MAEKQKKTINLPVTLIERINRRAKRERRVFTKQLIIDLETYLDREERLEADLASIELSGRT